jgi:hypothetical protein
MALDVGNGIRQNGEKSARLGAGDRLKCRMAKDLKTLRRCSDFWPGV